jgi:hypothetical protein
MKMRAKVIRLTGCFSPSRRPNCPYVRRYPKNQFCGSPESGCAFKYGSLPDEGFPDWCPLEDEEKKS